MRKTIRRLAAAALALVLALSLSGCGIYFADYDNGKTKIELKKRLVSNEKQLVRHRIYRQSQRYILTIGCILLGLLLIWHLG